MDPAQNSVDLLNEMLAGMGAQFKPGQDQAAQAVVAPGVPLADGTNIAVPCPYHSAILSMAINPPNTAVPMQRYLNAGPGEQPALFVRADNEKFSTSRGCTCVAR
ncbi:hypothetical protein EG328_008148 [Venturia inaequalis]|uniref:Uncharacterized protein n=1 Tax=Venturia inaequalis TaxID=5025 RepID=A0A8H3UCD1_VENIN|nr:hypothetical protein EG328_008148 [Venturia inaequalis]RDI83673.1 hypothetical protein Vi05172_g6222 [Venturia inaequalis]